MNTRMMQFVRDVVFCALLAVAVPRGLTAAKINSNLPSQLLVSESAVWRYWDNGAVPNASWRNAEFDDSAWKVGSAPLGYGDAVSTTLNFGNNPNEKFTTAYFRHGVVMSNPQQYQSFTLHLTRDDGAVVYWNGIEVARSNLPADTPITYTTRALVSMNDAEEVQRHPFYISPSLVLSGLNVIAVEVHQVLPSSSDLRFDLNVVGNKPITPLAAPPTQTLRFAVVGDFGWAGQPELDVSRLIRSWQPEFVTTVGDNNYMLGLTTTLYPNIGFYYGDWISATAFYPTLGNHDWGTGNADAYLNYFQLPVSSSGNERYYDFVKGDVHFFMVDSDPHEPDGIESNSVQAVWLKKQLALSKSPWKLVFMHHPPFSSSAHGSTPALQWQFAQWGATAVFAGHEHSYERLSVGGIPYFVNGLGGQLRYAFRTPLSQSVVRYNDDFGAMRVEANRCNITFQFVNKQNVVIDDYTQTHPCAPVFMPLVIR